LAVQSRSSRLHLRLSQLMTVPVPSDHDSDELAQWTQGAKRALRQQQRALRQALPEAASLARSQRIFERLGEHPRLLAARGVALFWPMLDRREIDLRPLDRQLRERGTALYYPYMERTGTGDIVTGFRFTATAGELVVGAERFAEPPAGARVAARGDVDVVVVPALAATLDGHRLGYGAGFYDATLPDLCPPAYSIIVVHDFQLLMELPLGPHDRACDEVITDRG
jgi:5-formyltetrahydrofolate cyclo-ligase